MEGWVRRPVNPIKPWLEMPVDLASWERLRVAIRWVTWVMTR